MNWLACQTVASRQRMVLSETEFGLGENAGRTVVVENPMIGNRMIG